MITPTTLTLTGDQHERLMKHLYPGDGKEAVAVALCGRRAGEQKHRLLVQGIYPVPYESCSVRTSVSVIWSTDAIVPLLEKAAARGLSVVKFHSHPTNITSFSKVDDEGDFELLPMVRDWIESDIPHGSVVVLPDGQMFGRVLVDETAIVTLDCINVVGDDLQYWYPKTGKDRVADFTASHAQLFGSGTTQRLNKLSVAVVGCSGTGSPVIEMLARLGVGELVLVDDDRIEVRNVNRIYGSTLQDAQNDRYKVDVLAEHIRSIGLGTEVRTFPMSLWCPDAVEAVAGCDVVFGCMDSIDGRYLLNSLATYYTQPYFDLGVRLVASTTCPAEGKINEVCGSVHFLKPGHSSLISRELVNMNDVIAAGLRRKDPAAYAQQMDDGYILGVVEHSPAVIHVNTFVATLAINEFLARLHPFREEHNSNFAQVEFSLSSVDLMPAEESDFEPCLLLKEKVGHGDKKPLLDMIELGIRREAA